MPTPSVAPVVAPSVAPDANVSRRSRKFRGLTENFHGLTEKSHGLSEMFHGLASFLPSSWQASPCVAERPGVTCRAAGATTGAAIGATTHTKIALDFQAVKCQV
jgi:hypothetical protein